MTFKTLLAAVAVSLVSTTAFAADYAPFKSEGGELIGQQVDAENYLLCELLNGDIALGNLECHLYPVADDGSFGRRPYEFTLNGGELVKKNVIRDTEATYAVAPIETSFSAAGFAGTWLGAEDSTYQVVSFSDDKGAMDYVYGDFPQRVMHFTLVGNVLVTPRVNGVQFLFLQDGAVTYGLRTDENGRDSHIVMMAEEFKWTSNAQCAQSYLNFAGFPVGRADGQPGPASKRGSEQYLAANPGVDLEPFTAANAEAWCSHLADASDVDAGAVAVAGF